MKDIKSLRNNKYDNILYFSIRDKASQDIAIYRINKISKFINKSLVNKKYIDESSTKLFLINEQCSIRNTFFNSILKNIVFEQRIKALNFKEKVKDNKNLFYTLLKKLIHFLIKPIVYLIEAISYILSTLILNNKVSDAQREIIKKNSILFVYPDDEINNLRYSRYKKRTYYSLIRISLGKSRYLFDHFISFKKILLKNRENKLYKLILIDSLFRIKDVVKFFLKIIFLYFFLAKDLIFYTYKIITINKRKNQIKLIEKRINLFNNIIGGSLLRRLLIDESIKYLLKEPNNLKEISYPKEGAFWEKLLENDFHKKKFFAESFSKTKVLDCRTLLPKKINEINIEKNLYTYDNSFNRNSINYFNFHEYKNITFFLTGFKHLDKELVEDAILLNSLFSMLKINFRSHPDTNLKIIDKIKRLEKNFFLNNSWDKSDIFFK